MASVSLPAGVIENHTVKDEKALSKILRESWQKLKINEKTVGIVIPEFATFTKLLSLPGLQTGELSEAINWQAKDFLPTGKEDMSVDWKLVEKNKEELKVLVVAVKQQILNSYVSSIDEAGLLPVIVEIPSLSLSRLIGEEKQDSLIVYTLEGEGILLVTKNGGILGSSVVFNSDKSDIVSTAKRISKHFDVDIKKIYIAGDLLGSGITSELEEIFKVVPSSIEINIEGLESKMFNEYLIPISLQFKKAFEPSDPRTVNLLPDFLVNRYKQKRVSIQVWGVTLTITLFIWSSFLLVLTMFLFLNQQYSSDLAKGNEQGSILQQRKQTVQQVNQINSTVDKVEEIRSAFVDPKSVLNDIFASSNENLVIQNYVLDLDKGSVRLEGVSSDRSNLIEFKQALEGLDEVDKVTIPISNFEVDENLEFTADINYKFDSDGQENDR